MDGLTKKHKYGTLNNKAVDGLFGRALGWTSAGTFANNFSVFLGQGTMNQAFGWEP